MGIKEKMMLQLQGTAAEASIKATQEIVKALQKIDENVIITHENQMEIDKRLERIEDALKIKR